MWTCCRQMACKRSAVAWNLAGLKCAAVVTASPAMASLAARFPLDTRWRIGHLGVIAAVAVYTEGEAWLGQLLRTLDHRRLVLGDLLAEQLPAISWQPPEATFLAWTPPPRPASHYRQAIGCLLDDRGRPSACLRRRVQRCRRSPVGLDYWITPGRASRLGSSLSDHFVRLPARTLPTRPPGGDDAAGRPRTLNSGCSATRTRSCAAKLAGFVTSQRTGYSSFTT